MLDGSFTDTGQSATWYAGRSGFSVALTMTGTNSVTLEKEIGGSWFAVGSAITSTEGRQFVSGSDFVPSTKFRLNCETHDTEDIDFVVQGDIFGDAVLADIGGIIADAWLLEDGTMWLLEDGSSWLLEAA
jgi:hypothetical protein